jgi:hypothetical protein
MAFGRETSRSPCLVRRTSRSRRRSTASGGFSSFFHFEDSHSRTESRLLGGRAHFDCSLPHLIQCNRPHFGKGRQVVDGQRIHASVSTLGAAYKPRALLPNEENLDNIRESDAFESARSIIGSLLKQDDDGSERVIVPEDIATQTTELLEYVDKSAYVAHISRSIEY